MHRLKILVTGGTGLYLNSLIYDMDFAKSNSNSKLREELELELKEKGYDVPDGILTVDEAFSAVSSLLKKEGKIW